MKKEWVELYNDTTLIAKQISDNEIELVNNSVELPFGLFEEEKLGEYVDIYHFYKWLILRVFPEDRIGVEDLLESMEIKEYNKSKIVRATSGRMFQDDYSIKWVEIC